MPAERVTYVTYNDGLQAKNLHLGNLVHDYKHPNSVEPHVETAYTDITEEPPSWARLTSLENYALTLGPSPPEESKSEDENHAADTGQRYRVVAGAKSTKIEVKDPKKFFRDDTLHSATARKWLHSHIAAGEDLGKSPEIWMLTGLILMQHATWTSLSSRDHSFVAGLQTSFDPQGVSQIRRLSVSDHVKPAVGYTGSDEGKHVSGAVIHETGKYPGTRGWAAQWQPVKVKILPAEKGQNGKSEQFVLKPLGKIAVVELREDVFAENEIGKASDEGFGEEYWDAFLDAVETYE